MLRIVNVIKGLYYEMTGRRKKLSPLFRIDGKEFQEWIDEDRYTQRVAELVKELVCKEKMDYKEVDFVWCLVGNIVETHAYGETKELRRGSKHFSSGAKVYCFPPLWGDGYERIKVIGRHRKTKRFIEVIIKSEHVTNWRLEKVYSPYIKKGMLEKNGWDNSEDSKERASVLLESLLQYKTNGPSHQHL